jgi:hypothetical protein
MCAAKTKTKRMGALEVCGFVRTIFWIDAGQYFYIYPNIDMEVAMQESSLWNGMSGSTKWRKNCPGRRRTHFCFMSGLHETGYTGVIFMLLTSAKEFAYRIKLLLQFA